MNKEKYIKSVLKKLQCSDNKKKEIRKELESDIQIALENGETWPEIEKRMEIPSKAASEFNDNFSDAEKKAAKRIKRRKTIAAVLGITAVIFMGIYWVLPKTYPLEASGRFQEQIVKKQAEEIILLVNADDYETIRNEYASEALKSLFEGSRMSDAKNLVGPDWGDFRSFGNAYTGEVRQMGKNLAVIQIHATYENTGVIYTVSFDEDMKLAGIYMK